MGPKREASKTVNRRIKFRLEGLNDPKNPLTCANCFGTENNVLVMHPTKGMRCSASHERRMNDLTSQGLQR